MAMEPSPCTCFHLRRTARRVTQLYDRELAAVGLSLNQYSILRRSRNGARAISGLAEDLGMDRTTLTRNLKPLLEANLLERERGDDARQRLVRLSAAGQARIAEARPHWQRAQARIDALFGPDWIARFHDDLDQLAERVAATEGTRSQ